MRGLRYKQTVRVSGYTISNYSGPHHSVMRSCTIAAKVAVDSSEIVPLMRYRRERSRRVTLPSPVLP
jgi:hypothetical protein